MTRVVLQDQRTSCWSQGETEKVDDETGSKYQTSFNGYVRHAPVRDQRLRKILQSLSFLSVDHKERDTSPVDWMREQNSQLDSGKRQSQVIKHTWSLATRKSITYV
jgi:hypothetical protein